jgi:hypothetical protein
MKHIEHRINLSVLTILGFAIVATQLLAATIPTGTKLIVRTVDNISSHDRVGRTFTAQLDHDVTVNGKAVLRAGTRAFGKVESSQVNPRKFSPLIVNLTGISVNGRQYRLGQSADSTWKAHSERLEARVTVFRPVLL